MTIKLFPMEFQWNFSGIPMESCGFHWESFPEALGFRPFPLEFLGKKWEFPWKWKPKWLRLQPNAFHRNSMEFCGILTFHWESGGIRRNSWRRVKTSNNGKLWQALLWAYSRIPFSDRKKIPVCVCHQVKTWQTGPDHRVLKIALPLDYQFLHPICKLTCLSSLMLSVYHEQDLCSCKLCYGSRSCLWCMILAIVRVPLKEW